MPKSLALEARPLPKCCCQILFTMTLEVSGLFLSAIQLARADLLPELFKPFAGGLIRAGLSSRMVRNPGSIFVFPFFGMVVSAAIGPTSFTTSGLASGCGLMLSNADNCFFSARYFSFSSFLMWVSMRWNS